jgi:hypothetical protein
MGPEVPHVGRRVAAVGLRYAIAGIAATAGCARPAHGPAVGDRQTAPRVEYLGHLVRPARGAAPDTSALGSGARLVPATLDEARFRGAGPGGVVRAIVSGVRVLRFADGTMETAPDRLPATPAAVVNAPDRLGGGFLFAIAKQLWRSDRWLSAATPIYTAPTTIGQVLVGLDRVYLRAGSGSIDAIDPRTGARLDLGPLPDSPHIGRIVARDAWRALVVADLRGTLLTTDAGSSWLPLALPVAPTEVDVAGDAFVVGGAGAAGDRALRWWRVGSDGRVEPLPAGPIAHPESEGDGAEAPPAALDPGHRIFGPVPLVAALEDGWPLDDATALVARDGTLARVRLRDGALVDVATRAFSPAPARCHPISLSRPVDTGAFGFACGEARGATRIYRWDAARGELDEIRRFDDPRLVLSFGNGALAAAGACAPTAAPADATPSARAWCVMSPEGTWAERTVRGQGANAARIVVLSDGRLATIRPPAGDAQTARLAIADAVGERTTDVALRWPALPKDALRAVALGTWLEGFEERRPGVLGGWVDAAGAVIGVEVTLDGELRVGEYIRDAGSPVVSGRWAFGWTASRRGFETTDGGMTWSKDISLPDRVAEAARRQERACGPIGCLVAGWLRVGWGPAELPDIPAPPPARTSGARPFLAPWHLRCAPLDPRPPSDSPTSASAIGEAAGIATRLRGRAASTASVPWGSVVEFPSFSGRPGPALRPGEIGFSVDASYGFERVLRALPEARLYAWGPSMGDWDAAAGRWQVRWDRAWSGWRDARASAQAPVPWTSPDATRHAFGVGPGAATAWIVAPGDDADHALLVARTGTPANVPGTALWVLESERPPLAVQQPSGEPFPDVENAIRASGRWYVATSQNPSEPPATVVWEIDGARARERARVPRAGFDTRPEARLARRTDGRALGLVVEGQPDLGRPPGLWVVGLDLESQGTTEPETVLAATNRPLTACRNDDTGWELDMAVPATIEIDVGDRWSSPLQNPVAHIRTSREHVCVDRVAGAVGAFATVAPSPLWATGATRSAPASGSAADIDVSVFSARARYGLRCDQGASQTQSQSQSRTTRNGR